MTESGGDITKAQEIEYEQICATYREGVRTLFETFKFYILFQAGLGTLAGAISSRPEFHSVITFPFTAKVNIPLAVLSLIGIFTAVGAPLVAKRLYKYHDVLVARARMLERAMIMNHISGLGDVWDDANSSARSATGISLLLFALVGIAWCFAVLKSFL